MKTKAERIKNLIGWTESCRRRSIVEFLIEEGMKEGLKKTQIYNKYLKGKRLIRKQTALDYVDYLSKPREIKDYGYFIEETVIEIEKVMMYALIDDLQRNNKTYLHVSYRDINTIKEEDYDASALFEIREWFTDEIEQIFTTFRILESDELNISEDFDIDEYTSRTFEMEIMHMDFNRMNETAYYLVYRNGEITGESMWSGFNYLGFRRVIKSIGAWE